MIHRNFWVGVVLLLSLVSNNLYSLTFLNPPERTRSSELTASKSVNWDSSPSSLAMQIRPTFRFGTVFSDNHGELRRRDHKSLKAVHSTSLQPDPKIARFRSY